MAAAAGGPKWSKAGFKVMGGAAGANLPALIEPAVACPRLFDPDAAAR